MFVSTLIRELLCGFWNAPTWIACTIIQIKRHYLNSAALKVSQSHYSGQFKGEEYPRPYLVNWVTSNTRSFVTNQDVEFMHTLNLPV